MTGNLNAYFHGNARFAPRSYGSFWDPHPKSHARYSLSRRPLQHGRDMAESKLFLPLALHVVETAIRRAEQFFDAGAVGGKYRQAHADADRRLLTGVLYFLANTWRNLLGFFRSRPRQDQCKL